MRLNVKHGEIVDNCFQLKLTNTYFENDQYVILVNIHRVVDSFLRTGMCTATVTNKCKNNGRW